MRSVNAENPSTLLHHIRRAYRRPDAHEEVDVIGLHRQFQNRPPRLVARLAKQVFAPCPNLSHQHLAPTLGTPDKVVAKQMHLLLVAVVVQVTYVVPPVDTPPLYLQNGTRRDFWLKPTQALASAWPEGTAALRAVL